jgi:hypothetical protein
MSEQSLYLERRFTISLSGWPTTRPQPGSYIGVVFVM